MIYVLYLIFITFLRSRSLQIFKNQRRQWLDIPKSLQWNLGKRKKINKRNIIYRIKLRFVIPFPCHWDSTDTHICQISCYLYNISQNNVNIIHTSIHQYKIYVLYCDLSLAAVVSLAGLVAKSVSYWQARISGCTWLVCHRSSSETVD